MKTNWCGIAVALALLAPNLARAQAPFPRDVLVFSTANSAFRMLDIGTWSEVGGQSFVNSYWRMSSFATFDDRGFLYDHYYDQFPTTFMELSRWGRDPSMPPWQWLSSSPPWRLGLASTLNIGGRLAATRSSIVVLFDDGRFATITKDIPGQSISFQGSSLPPALNAGAPLVNGREMFMVVQAPGPVPNPAFYFEVFAQDLLVSGAQRRFIAHVPSPWGVLGFALGRDGLLNVGVPGAILEIDPVTGTTVATETITWPNLLGGLAYDPWFDRAVMADPFSNTLRTTFVWSQLHGLPTTWSLAYTSPPWYMLGYPYDGLTAFRFTNEQPFEYFGVGCLNAVGLEPRLGWQGLPKQGQAFSIKLRQAEPNTFAFFWLGLSDSYWLGLQLPFEGSSLGAPGCSLLVSADIPFPVAIDSNGHAALSVAVPVNPSLAGMQVFAQSASSSGANALGFASSDALVIRVR